jgi:hydroxymethylpyrimidine pyrophosphatase-like HAD family hydrolase
VVTVGDSPNDESLFDGDRFPLSVGVANIQHYLQQLQHQPRYITQASEVEGFSEFAHGLIQAVTPSP